MQRSCEITDNRVDLFGVGEENPRIKIQQN